jgi:membrane protease YdiL (CAAX protease family)
LPTTNPRLPEPTGFASSPALSAVEFLLGAAIVIGHNVLRIVPNEVPILVALALLSMRLRTGKWAWSSLGFVRPTLRIVVIAVAAATLRVLLGTYVIDPLTANFWPPASAPAVANEISGNIRAVLLYLPVVWLFAAFGEEIAYRGYLLNRAADCMGRSNISWWVAVFLVSVLFGYGHYYKGPAGIVDSGVAGLILGAAYLLSGRNLWTTILAHGLIDTFALLAVYLGWDS